MGGRDAPRSLHRAQPLVGPYRDGSQLEDGPAATRRVTKLSFRPLWCRVEVASPGVRIKQAQPWRGAAAQLGAPVGH